MEQNGHEVSRLVRILSQVRIPQDRLPGRLHFLLGCIGQVVQSIAGRLGTSWPGSWLVVVIEGWAWLATLAAGLSA